MALPFIRMNGAGNAFLVVAPQDEAFEPTPEQVRAWAGWGRGCDQLISITHSDVARAGMRIWNANGGEVEACGNAARCVGWLLMEAAKSDSVTLAAGGRVLEARRVGERLVTVDMGEPGLAWQQIPLAWEVDTRRVTLGLDPRLRAPGCVSMGNPHVVFFVPDLDRAPVSQAGPRIEQHWLFPQRVNVGFAQVKSPDRMRLKVWERGVGLTAACGTGACAAVVAAHRQGICGRIATVEMDGGDLRVEWREWDNRVLLTGPVEVETSGLLPMLERAA